MDKKNKNKQSAKKKSQLSPTQSLLSKFDIIQGAVSTQSKTYAKVKANVPDDPFKDDPAGLKAAKKREQ